MKPTPKVVDPGLTLGPPPTGPGSTSKMRLVIMAHVI